MTLTRRHFLRAAGVALALPPFASLAGPTRRSLGEGGRRRLVAMCAPLGLHPAYFLPEKAGKDYALTPYLEVVKDFRKDFTIISGLSHAGMSPSLGHHAGQSFLTSAPGAGRPGFRNSISMDQLAAEHVGDQ